MTQNNIRNFVIMAHIDHGKSTLADRFLEITKTVDSRKMQPQFLDRMAIERERGITIKMQPVKMIWKEYILNLIDTPGHVDFSYEVSRSLAAVEGAILLVDATQGVQAQTLTNLEFAKKENLIIIPAINKIDLPTANIEQSIKEIEKLLNVKKEDIILISAKTGENVEKLLERVVEKVPAPIDSPDKNLRALIFDSDYDVYKGVVAYVRIFNGQIKKGNKTYLMQAKANAEALELGYFHPELVEGKELKSGEIGYIATGLKEIDKCRVGDTITLQASNYNLESLKGYKEPQPVVFASFYPIDSDDYDLLNDGLRKLKLNDASLSFNPESSGALGRGFRCGFLGMLHLEIVSERLKRDYGLDLITTSPSVVYRKDKDNKIEEPVMDMEIIVFHQYLGAINKLLSNFPGEFKDTTWLTDEKIIIKFEAPLDIVLHGFYDKLKTVSSGYASMSYQIKDYKPADLIKLDILIDKENIEAFSKIVRRSEAYREGKRLVELLKEILPYYQWSVPIQAVVGGKIVARETKRAMRKDVTGYLYGGDYSRKRKLLEKQKKGKKKMAQFGRITIPSEVFLKILKAK
ncbi:translation elongation factor 4 [Patescibacteria group bacterium]|nr:translation elongation factor 4 [Patescibacteria group bacterium]MBU4458665.1 translation elongation factor 4 [Patescibacteria group bacterium]MCG2696024.1 translation elongation factor 4 [Candidatus Portnoybacteria bacterium]